MTEGFTNRQLTPTGITTTKPVRVTKSAHGLTNGERVRATEFYGFPPEISTGFVQLNNLLFSVQNCTTNTFDLYDILGNAIDGTNYTPFTSVGTPQFTLTGPSLNVQNTL